MIGHLLRQRHLLKLRLMVRNMYSQHDDSLSTSRHAVDLRSDTVTLPDQKMKEAMISCPLGDDVFKEDPTVNALEKYCAQFFGMEAALLVPSGSMGNLIAIMCHTTGRGDEIITGREQHTFKYEQGGYAQFASVSATAIHNAPDGTIPMDKIKAAIRPDDFHQPVTRLICLENTHNYCGGVVLPQDYMDEVCAFAKQHDLKVHVDGARIANAAIAEMRPVSDLLAGVDSVSMCLSKGLGAPVGSVIGGTHEFIKRATFVRKGLGGGMRQAGVLAAAGLYALETHVDRLTNDHLNANRLAIGINNIRPDVMRVDMSKVQTNMVFPEILADFTADVFCEKMEKGAEINGQLVSIKAFPATEKSIRLVTHCNVNSDDIDRALGLIDYLLSNIE